MATYNINSGQSDKGRVLGSGDFEYVYNNASVYSLILTGTSNITFFNGANGQDITALGTSSITDYGTITTANLSVGSTLNVFLGGTAGVVTVGSGAVLNAYGGATLTGVIVNSGGRLNDYSTSNSLGPIVINSGGQVDLNFLTYVSSSTTILPSTVGSSTNILVLQGQKFFQLPLANAYVGETFSFTPDGAGGTLVTNITAAAKYAIAADSASKADSLQGTTAYTFKVTRTGNLNQAAVVTYTVAGTGSSPASNGMFASNSGTVEFAPNASVAQITVNVQGGQVTSEKDFAVALGGSTDGGTFTVATAAGAILPNYFQPLRPAGASEIGVHGSHGDFTVAYDPSTGLTAIQDSLAGRDGSIKQTGVSSVIFSDGVGRIDITGNSEEATRLYRAAFGRTPDAVGLDNVTAPINAGTLNITGVASYFISSPEFTNRYGVLSNQSFVQQLYQNVLHRTGSGTEVQGWVGQIDTGMSRAAVLVGFSDSYENKVNTLSYSGDKDYGESYRLYQAAFNRTPDDFGQRGFTTSLDQGASLADVAQQFIISSEFANAYAGLDSKGFVSQLYQNVLHRTGSASEVSGWVGQINAGTSRASVLIGFSDSLENRINTAATTHDNWIFLTS